jgi:hypothetical protein
MALEFENTEIFVTVTRSTQWPHTSSKYNAVSRST